MFENPYILIPAFFLSFIYLAIYHKIFNVIYFGCQAVAKTWFWSLVTAYITIYLVVHLFIEYWPWILGIVGVLVILGMIGASIQRNNEIIESTESDQSDQSQG